MFDVKKEALGISLESKALNVTAAIKSENVLGVKASVNLGMEMSIKELFLTEISLLTKIKIHKSKFLIYAKDSEVNAAIRDVKSKVKKRIQYANNLDIIVKSYKGFVRDSIEYYTKEIYKVSNYTASIDELNSQIKKSVSEAKKSEKDIKEEVTSVKNIIEDYKKVTKNIDEKYSEVENMIVKAKENIEKIVKKKEKVVTSLLELSKVEQFKAGDDKSTDTRIERYYKFYKIMSNIMKIRSNYIKVGN